MKTLLLATLALSYISGAMADETALCRQFASSRDFVIAKGGKWIELTAKQRLFVEGIYVLDPATPKGLPFGDKAIMATLPDKEGGLIFWIDGDLGCVPMPLPKEIVEMLSDVETDVIHHEGQTN